MATVEAKGFSEFNAALAKFQDDFPRVVRDIALHAVTMTVTDAVPTIPRESGRAASSVQGFVTNEGASVTGGTNLEYYRWLELGGASGRSHANVRPIVKDGRYINPAFQRNEAEIQAAAEKMLARAAESVGLEVKE